MKYSADDVATWLTLSNEKFNKIKTQTETETETQLKQHMALIRAIKNTNESVVYVLFHDFETNPKIPFTTPLYFSEKACKLSQSSTTAVQGKIGTLFASTVTKISPGCVVILECSPDNRDLFGYMKSLRNSTDDYRLVVVFRYPEFFLAFKQPIAGSKWVKWNLKVLDKKLDNDNSQKDGEFRPLCFEDRTSAADALIHSRSFSHTIDLHEPVSNYQNNKNMKATLLSQRCSLEALLYTMPCKDEIWKCRQQHSIRPNHVLMYGGYPYLGLDGYKWMLDQLEKKESKYGLLFTSLDTTVAEINFIVDTTNFNRTRFEIDQEITKTPYRQLQIYTSATDEQSPWSLGGAIIYNYMASDLATLLSPSRINKYFGEVTRDRFFIYAQAFMPMMRVRIIKEGNFFMLVQQDEQNGKYLVLPIISNIWCPDQYILIRAKKKGNYLVPLVLHEYKTCIMYNYMLNECKM